MELKKNNTDDIFDTLFQRLLALGLMPVEIPRLIKDVFNIVSDGEDYTVAYINQELERVGWRTQIIDEFNFELVIFLLENKYEFEVIKQTLH